MASSTLSITQLNRTPGATVHFGVNTPNSNRVLIATPPILNDALGQEGASAGWDLLDAQGGLSITSTQDDPFVIVMQGLDAEGNIGGVTNFDPLRNFTWSLVDTASLAGLDVSLLALDLTDLLHDNPIASNGFFQLRAAPVGLRLDYFVPEPASLTALLSACLLLFRSTRCH